MAERLAAGNVAIALLANTLATGPALVVLISIFGPISGAHFNPAVTTYFGLRREMPPALALAYVVAQFMGAVCGVWAAHLMFEAPAFELSTKLRDGGAQAFSEFVTTFGLIGTIAGAVRYSPKAATALVGLYISAAYWFTASTSFANPAVAIARALRNSFAGIAPHSAPPLVVAQLLGAVAGFCVFGWCSLPQKPRRSQPLSVIKKSPLKSTVLCRNGRRFPSNRFVLSSRVVCNRQSLDATPCHWCGRIGASRMSGPCGHRSTLPTAEVTVIG